MILTYTATEEDCGRTVYSAMRRELKVSATLMRRLKATGAITVAGAPVFTNYRLSPGETVALDITNAEPPCDNIPEQGDLEILFENEGLLAVNKQSGILVHPSRSKNTGTLANFVAGYLAWGITGRGQEEKIYRNGSHASICEQRRTEQQSGCQVRLCPDGVCHAVNRLDRDTSGVVLFAKNSYMKAIASTAISDETAVKEYIALVYGKTPECGAIDVPIKRFEERNMLRIPSEDGQRAVTRYETINTTTEKDEHFSLIRLRLETGRTHQIRVHCLHIGHPVLGDKLYSTDKSRNLSEKLGITTQALHAYKLGFNEPLSKKCIEIIAGINTKNFPCIFPKDVLAY